MNRKIASAIVVSVLFLCLFSLSACKSNVQPGIDENLSQSELSYIAQEQGICILSTCRMQPDEELVSLSGQEDAAGIVVLNNSDKTLQYAEITATFSDGTIYLYKLSTLPPGETCFVEEEAASPYRELSEGFSGFNINNIAFFLEEPSVHSDKLQFSGADGVLTVKNISDADITDNIVIYYKDYKDSQLASGKTYRVTVKEGLAKGEITQIAAAHYKQNASIIMFVQFVPSEVSG